jgi:5-aminolevulinate synthase
MVQRRTERLRITPTPFHSDAHIAALVEVWAALGRPFAARARAAECPRSTFIIGSQSVALE